MTIIVGGARAIAGPRAYLGYEDSREPQGMMTPPSTPLPTSAHLEPLPPMQQVGPTCFAYAASQWLRMLAIRDGIVMDAPSPAWLAWYSRYIDTGGDELTTKARVTAGWGSYTRSTILGAQLYGIAPESVWPSTDEHFARFPAWTAKRVGDDKRLQLDGLVYCSSLDDVARTIADLHSPVMVSLPVYTEIRDNDGSRVLDSQGVHLGGHVWLAVGFDGVGKDRVWELQTSWGTCGIGGKGLFRATEKHLREGVDLWGCKSLVLTGGAP